MTFGIVCVVIFVAVEKIGGATWIFAKPLKTSIGFAIACVREAILSEPSTPFLIRVRSSGFWLLARLMSVAPPSDCSKLKGDGSYFNGDLIYWSARHRQTPRISEPSGKATQSVSREMPRMLSHVCDSRPVIRFAI